MYWCGIFTYFINGITGMCSNHLLKRNLRKEKNKRRKGEREMGRNKLTGEGLWKVLNATVLTVDGLCFRNLCFERCRIIWWLQRYLVLIFILVILYTPSSPSSATSLNFFNFIRFLPLQIFWSWLVREHHPLADSSSPLFSHCKVATEFFRPLPQSSV